MQWLAFDSVCDCLFGNGVRQNPGQAKHNLTQFLWCPKEKKHFITVTCGNVRQTGTVFNIIPQARRKRQFSAQKMSLPNWTIWQRHSHATFNEQRAHWDLWGYKKTCLFLMVKRCRIESRSMRIHNVYSALNSIRGEKRIWRQRKPQNYFQGVALQLILDCQRYCCKGCVLVGAWLSESILGSRDAGRWCPSCVRHRTWMKTGEVSTWICPGSSHTADRFRIVWDNSFTCLQDQFYTSAR